MNKMSERQIMLLKSSVDLSISTLGSQLISAKDKETRNSQRSQMKEFIELADILNELKPKK